MKRVAEIHVLLRCVGEILDETEEEAEEPTQLEWELDEDDGPPSPQPPPQQLTQPSQPQPQQPPQQPSVSKPPGHQPPLPEEEPPTPLLSNSGACIAYCKVVHADAPTRRRRCRAD